MRAVAAALSSRIYSSPGRQEGDARFRRRPQVMMARHAATDGGTEHEAIDLGATGVACFFARVLRGSQMFDKNQTAA